MNTNTYFSGMNYIYRISFFLMLLMLSITYRSACANTIWSKSLDYVALASVEEGYGENQHPVTISPRDIYAILSAVRHRDSSSSKLLGNWFGKDDDETFSDQFFVKTELRKLSPAISKALAEAKPEQDIVFSITGLHSAAIGSSSLSSTGRIFFKDGRFNLIIGETFVNIEKRYRRAGLSSNVSSKVDERELRSFKLAVGSRIKPVKSKAVLIPYKGLTLVENRTDWLTLPVDAISSLSQRSPSKELEQKTLKQSNQRTTALEAKVEKLENKLDKKEQNIAPSSQQRSIEERLAHLKRLYDKDYITEEVYEKKMHMILSDL